MSKRRERIAIATAKPAPAPVDEAGPFDDALAQAEAALTGARPEAGKRDPFLDDVQRLFSSPEGERFLAWVKRCTLEQQVRVLTTKSMSREAAQDFALYREGQNSLALTILNLVAVANEEPPASRTSDLIFDA